MKESFMSPGRGFMESFYYVMAGQFGDIEPIFEIEMSVLIYPVLFVGSWKPGFSSFIIHGGKGFTNNRI